VLGLLEGILKEPEEVADVGEEDTGDAAPPLKPNQVDKDVLFDICCDKKHEGKSAELKALLEKYEVKKLSELSEKQFYKFYLEVYAL